MSVTSPVTKHPVALASPSLARSTVYNFVALNSAAIFGSLSSIATARYLGVESFDALTYALWLQSLLVIVATLGIPGTVSRYVAEYLGRNDVVGAGLVGRRLGRLTAVTTLTTLVLFAVEEQVFGAFEAPNIITVMCALAATGVAQSVLVAWVLGLRQMRTVAVQGSIVYPLQFAVLLFILTRGGGVEAVLWLNVSVNLVSIAILAAGVSSGVRTSGAAAVTAVAPPWPRIGRYILTLSGITLIDAIVWQRSEIFFLRKFAPATTVGFYHLAFGLSQLLVKTVGTALLGVLMPYFASLHGASDDVGVQQLFARSTRWLAFFTLPLVAFGTALGADIIALLYGHDYAPVALALPILLLSAAAGTIAGGGAALLYGVERQGVILKIGAATAVLNIVLDLVLIPRYHLLGAAAANAVAQVAAATLGLTYIVVAMRVAFPWRAVGVTIASSLAALFAMVCCQTLVDGLLGTAIAATVGPMVFLGGQQLLRFYEPVDHAVMHRVLGRVSQVVGRGSV